MSDQTVVTANRPEYGEHKVPRSVSHYDTRVYGEPKYPKTQSESFQHMVNLVFYHSPCQVKFNGPITALHSLGP